MSYSKHEAGENDILAKVLIQIAKYHNTSVDYLLNLTDEIGPYPKKGAVAFDLLEIVLRQPLFLQINLA